MGLVWMFDEFVQGPKQTPYVSGSGWFLLMRVQEKVICFC